MAESQPTTTLPGIDANTLSRIAGVSVGTLNVWIGRDLIPGVSIGTQGRARVFDLDTAIHVTIMTALVRQGYAAPFAADVAFGARQAGWHHRGKMAIVRGSRPRAGRLTEELFTSCEAPSLTRLASMLDRRGRPEVFTVIEIDRLAERVRRVFMNLHFIEKSEHPINTR